MATCGGPNNSYSHVLSLPSPQVGGLPGCSIHASSYKATILLAKHAERHRAVVPALHHSQQVQCRGPWTRSVAATYGSFNETVSIDLMVPFKSTHSGNDYIIVMQDPSGWRVEHLQQGSLHSGRWSSSGVDPETWYPHLTAQWLGKEFTAVLHKEVCDLLSIIKTYFMAHHPQANDMVERCNRTLLVMLRTVVSEQQNDSDDQITSILHSRTVLCPYCMVYGAEITMPLDWVVADVGRGWSNVHCPTEYVEWLRGSKRDAHAMDKTSLDKGAKRQ